MCCPRTGGLGQGQHHFWRRILLCKIRTPNPPKKEPSEARARRKRGVGGNSASPEPKRSPAALLVQNRGQQKSFLFLLEEKEIARQIKKCEENFFTGRRAKQAAAGRSVQNSQSGFLSKKVRILTKRHRQFSKFGFWAIITSPITWAS